MPPKIRACLFDMDGLLIDSEDIYTRVTNEILAQYGKPKLPWSIKAKLQGRPNPEAERIFSEWAQLPISNAEYSEKNRALQQEYFPQTQPLKGVPELLKKLGQSDVQMALATSSMAKNFRIKSAHLQDLFSVFSEDKRVLGDDPRIPKGRGKPAPDIYLLALKCVNDSLLAQDSSATPIKPEECLVFEDSVPGVESGRRAKMQVVWCPHPELLVEYKGREKQVLAGLTGEHTVEDIPPAVGADDNGVVAGTKVDGAPGAIDDGWAVFLDTLEEFPYEKFGISV